MKKPIQNRDQIKPIQNSHKDNKETKHLPQLPYTYLTTHTEPQKEPKQTYCTNLTQNPHAT